MTSPFNPLVREGLESAIRSLLKAAGGMLVAWGYASPDSAVIEYLVGVLLFGAGIAWSQVSVYMSRKKLVVALAAPEALSEAQVETRVKAGHHLPKVSTPKTVVPVDQGTRRGDLLDR